MTKADLVEKIYERLSCQQKEDVELMELVMETLKEAVGTEGPINR